MALISAVICMQVLHEIVANAMIRKFCHLQQKPSKGLEPLEG